MTMTLTMMVTMMHAGSCEHSIGRGAPAADAATEQDHAELPIIACELRQCELLLHRRHWYLFPPRHLSLMLLTALKLQLCLHLHLRLHRWPATRARAQSQSRAQQPECLATKGLPLPVRRLQPLPTHSPSQLQLRWPWRQWRSDAQARPGPTRALRQHRRPAASGGQELWRRCRLPPQRQHWRWPHSHLQPALLRLSGPGPRRRRG